MLRFFAMLFLALGLLMPAPRHADAASRSEIDADVTATLEKFYARVPGGFDLVQRAAGVLVFPSVVKAGMGIGGEYGEGALRAGGATIDYYNTVSASVGFQLGVQARSVLILFMTPESLASFRARQGWKVGVDGSVALVTLGAGGALDTNTIRRPVIGFILDNKGLMYNLTLEGSKISRIRR
jgi:lipid-binding SYLF domain-containing protein